MNYSIQTVLYFLLGLFVSGKCYNILAVFHHPGSSHIDVFQPLVQELVRRGHSLTVISSISLKITDKNYKEIIVEFDKKVTLNAFEVRTRNKWEHFTSSILLASEGHRACNEILSDKNVQTFIGSKNTFDLAILEFFNTDCFLSFAKKYEIPFVGMSSCSIMPWINDRFANIDNPSYIPNNHMYSSDRIPFQEKIENVFCTLLYKIVYNYYSVRIDQPLVEKYFGRTFPPLNEIAKNASVLLVNTHYSLHFARPLVPGIVEIGGIHLKKLGLNKNIEKFINESSHGVIYFSLGSMIKGHTFPEEKREQFLKAFARLPQRVLWKWENETMPGKPDNVMIQQWMPQFDILCHPNVKAFISHGGLLGTTEAVHCGVPMIVMPQYGDQHTNARAVEANGGGVIMDLEDATEEKVYDALKTILSPEFNAKTKELSARFRDRPMSPMDTAIYWVEYVARHKGAPHMRTAAVGMPLYQYLLLDVIAFIVFVITVFVLLTFYTLRSIFRLLFRKKEKSEQTNKSKVLQNKKNK